MPPVDGSKEKDAIPPPGAEKKDETKSDAPPADKAKNADVKRPDAAPEPVALDVSGFALSADGKWVAVWARDPQTPGEKKQKDAKADASWVNHEKHGTRLYLAALKADGANGGALKPVAIAPDVRGAVWSPASDRLLVFTEAPNDLSDLGPAGAAWVVDAATPDKAHKARCGSRNGGGRRIRAPMETRIVFSAANAGRRAAGIRRAVCARRGTTQRPSLSAVGPL